MIIKPLRIALSGALGKMGQNLIKELQITQNIILSLAIIKKNESNSQKMLKKIINTDNKNKIITSDCLKNNINLFDVLIDFSNPKATINHLEICAQSNKKVVIGTTGFNQKEDYIIHQLSKKISIVKSSNYSIGINLMLRLLELTTQIMGNNSDIEIIESHHHQKIDAPSGTAISLGKKIAHTMNWNFKKHAVFTRSGLIGPRKKNEIGFSTIRAGDIVGKHTVIFENKDERITIKHKANNRSIFSKGAVKSAFWLNTINKPGLFNMSNVLNL